MSNTPSGQPQGPEWQPGHQPPPWSQPTPSLPPAPPPPPAPDWGPSAAYESAPDYQVPASQYRVPEAQFQPQQPPYPPQPAPYQTPYGVVAPMPSPYAPTAYAPYGTDPVTGIPYSDKSKLVAGLLQIFLGSFGVGRFYLGDIGMGVAQILVTFLTLGLGALWPLIDGIMLLAGSPRDRNGRPLRS